MATQMQLEVVLTGSRITTGVHTNHVLQNPWSENWLSVGFSGFLKINSPAYVIDFLPTPHISLISTRDCYAVFEA